MGLKISETLDIPTKVAQEVTLVLGTRGYGKCLHGDSKVLLSNGQEVPIRDIDKYPDEKIVCLGPDFKLLPVSRMELTTRPVEKLLKIRTRSGREIKLTPEHPLMDRKGWRPAETFVPGESIATVAQSAVFWDEIATVEELRGDFTVYDIGVPDYHNFIAENFVVHNSYTLGVLLEELHKNGIQFAVWDPLGAHRLIRMPGVEVITIQKGQTINIPKLVNRLMQSKSSVIINMMEIMAEPATSGVGTRQQELVGQFSTALLRVNPASANKVIVTVIEEAEEFAPMGTAKWIMQSIIPLNQLTKMGRARGCGVIFVTQRPQDFSSKLRSQASNFIVHRLTNYTELDVMQKQLIAATRGETRPIIQKIFALQPGEAMVLSPSVVPNGLAFVKVRQRETEHAGKNVIESGDITGFTPPGFSPLKPEELPLAYGSKEDLSEIIVPVVSQKKKTDKLGVTATVILLAAGGVTAYVVYDYYQKKRVSNFEEMESQSTEARLAMMNPPEPPQPDKKKKKKKTDITDIENLDVESQAAMEGSSISPAFTAPRVDDYPMDPTRDPFTYDPFSPK